jgi:hypothetical protein
MRIETSQNHIVFPIITGNKKQQEEQNFRDNKLAAHTQLPLN